VIRHEGDGFGGDQRGGSDEVCLVLAPGIICDDDKAPGLHLGDDFINGRKLQLAHKGWIMTANFQRARSVQCLCRVSA